MVMDTANNNLKSYVYVITFQYHPNRFEIDFIRLSLWFA